MKNGGDDVTRCDCHQRWKRGWCIYG